MAVGCNFMLRTAKSEYPKLAPYPAIRWTPEVQIDGKWYALRSVDDLPVATIVEFAKEKYDSNWLKRFNEDLVQVLTEMGHPPGETIKLVLHDLETGQEKTLDKTPLTAEYREAIRNPIRRLKPEVLRNILDDFMVALNDRWSYRHANGADFDAAIAKLYKEIDAGIALNDFGIELQKIIALGIDGHAEVSGYTLPSGGYLPFLVEPSGEGFVAFKPDRTRFLADGFPYLTKIDGKPVADWCEAAAVLVPKGSPQYVRRHCLRLLRDLDYLRGLMKLPKNAAVEVEVAAQDGARKRLTLPVATQSPIYGVWPRGGSRLLEGNIGYLRLSSLDEDAVAEISTWMPKFRDTEGLVIDVRDNGGGIRDPMRLLYSFLTSPEDPPRVFTVAAYRLHGAHRRDHLGQRFMYRADAEEWTGHERHAIATFASIFSPEWELPPGQFSDWHYMVLSRLHSETSYHYSQPVVVLMNAKCFSATDIFLAGLKGMNNVTLLGTPSGGGSAFAQSVTLGATPFRVRLGSMASFQTDGKLFEGYGVNPDMVVEPMPEYYIGGTDNVLEAAVRRIKREQ
jgi:Peptidase family S41